MSSQKDVQELKNILIRINTGLKELLKVVKDPTARFALEHLEGLSRWKETALPNNYEAVTFAIARAKKRAKEEGEAFVVAQSKDQLVLVAKRRFHKEHPFDLQVTDVIYDTELA